MSHIRLSEIIDADTQIGTTLVNFLVSSKIDPNANVAIILDTQAGRELHSLYTFDLYDPVAALPNSADIILTSVNFENEIDKRRGLEALVEYLEGITNKSYDDSNILDKALFELERLPAIVVEKITPVVVGQRGGGPRSGYVPNEQVYEEVITTSKRDNDPRRFTPSDTHRQQMVYGSRFGNVRRTGY